MLDTKVSREHWHLRRAFLVAENGGRLLSLSERLPALPDIRRSGSESSAIPHQGICAS